MAEYATPQGGFAQGLGRGAQVGGQIADRRAKREQQRQEAERQARKDKLEESALIKERLLEGTDISDPQMRKLYFGQVIKHVEGRTGEKAPQWIAQLANSDPATFKQMMKAADSQGMTMLDIWKIGQNPLDSASAILAFNKSKQNDETRKTLGETNDPLVPSEESAAGPNAGLIASLQGRIQRAKQGIDNAMAGGASAEGIKAMQSRLATDEKYLFDLSQQSGSAKTSEAEKPVTEGLFEKAKADEQAGVLPKGTVYPGMTYGELRAGYKKGTTTIPSGPTPAAGAAMGRVPAKKVAPTAPSGPISPQVRPLQRPSADTGSPQELPIVRPVTGEPNVRMNVMPKGAMSEQQGIEFREQSQLRNQAVPESVLRETGASNYGQLMDGMATGKIRPMSPIELARREQAAKETERVYGKKFEDYQTKGEAAKISRNMNEAMLTLIERAGTTGPWISPIRKGVNAFVQALSGGSIVPEGMSEMAMLESFSMKMAIQDLQRISGNDSDRDFLRAITSNPGIFTTPEMNINLLIYRIQLDKLEEHRATQAQRWVDQFGSLSRQDPESRKAFDQTWSEWSRKPEHSAVQLLAETLNIPKLKDVYKKFNIPYRGKP